MNYKNYPHGVYPICFGDHVSVCVSFTVQDDDGNDKLIAARYPGYRVLEQNSDGTLDVVLIAPSGSFCERIRNVKSWTRDIK